MPSTFCSVDGCGNRKSNKIPFFSLPADKERRKTWIEIIGRSDLLTRAELNHRCHFVCAVHFDESMTTNRLLLKPDAIPSKLVPNPKTITVSQLKPGFNTQTTQTTDSITNHGNVTSVALIEKPTSKSIDTQTGTYVRCSETQTTSCLTEGTSRTRNPYSELRVWYGTDDESDEVVARFNKLASWHAKLKSHSKGNRYDPEYELFALNLHFQSPTTYRHLKTLLNLPSESTLQRFKLQVPPKINDGVFDCIAKRIQSLPEQAKYCILCIDEMALKSHLYYDIKKDEFVGIHTINGEVEGKIASKACVIMIRGIVIDWVQPVVYSLLDTSKHYNQIETWIEEVITRLSGIGIEIVAIVSDEGSEFDKYAKEVKRVTAEKPYITFKDKKVYCIFDVPHLIKCLRNNLLTNDFHYDSKQVSWKYIKSAYEQQKETNLRLMHKITKDHIAPNKFQKMRIKYASQIFSISVFTALTTLIYTKNLPEEARATAEFVEKINNLFDVLNSSAVKCSNKYQAAFSLKEHQMDVLQGAQELFTKMTAVNLQSRNNSTKRINAFINIQITIQSIIMLYKDLKDKGFTFLFTRRLNQDPLKKIFGIIRQQGGDGKDPTSIQFTRAFSKLFLSNMLRNLKTGNCQEDLSDLLDRQSLPDKGNLRDLLVASAKAAPTLLTLHGDLDYRFDVPTEDAFTYVAGYLLYKCSKEHQCPDFNESQKELLKLSETRMYTQYIALNRKSGFYVCLKMPMESFIIYVRTLEKVFLDNFVKMSLTSPGNSLFQTLKAIPFQGPCLCFPHHYLLKFFIRFRIYKVLKFNNRSLRSSDILQRRIQLNHI